MVSSWLRSVAGRVGLLAPWGGTRRVRMSGGPRGGWLAWCASRRKVVLQSLGRFMGGLARSPSSHGVALRVLRGVVCEDSGVGCGGCAWSSAGGAATGVPPGGGAMFVLL